MHPFEKQRFEYEIAQWLTSIREEKGLSQDYLGQQIGKGQSDVAKIEKGQRKVTVLELLVYMTALDIPFDRLSEVLEPIYSRLIQINNTWEK